MENTSIPHSLPKPTFFSNSNSDVALAYPSHSHKSQFVYDGVFNTPPKFGIPTLAPPRLQDYSEIFGGFHSSRSSAIPFLHLPLPPHHDSHLPSDLRRLSFDYSDVFGGGFSFTASFQDLFGQFGAGGYQSPDDQWSPAQSETPSDELDPLAGCDKNSILSDAEFHRSLGSIKTVLNNASGHVRNLSAVPPYTFTQYESSVSWHGNEKHCPVNEPDDIDCIEEFGEWVITETKQAKYCLSKSLHGGFNDAHVNEFNPSEKHGNSPSAKPFMTVSDISLRTRPSQLPPPSRPPPPLGVKLNERVVCDVAPLLFDVKGDDAVFAEGCRERDASVKVDPESDTETVDSMDMCSLDALRLSSCEGERIFGLHGEENASCVPVNADGTASRKSTGDALESWGLLGFNHYTLETEGAAAGRDATGYIEINANQINKQPFNMVDGCDTVMQEMIQDSHRHDRPIDHGEFNQKDISKKFIRSKEVPEKNPTVRIQQTIWDEEMNPSEMSGEHCDLDGKLQQGKETTMSEDQKLSKLGNICDSSQTAENFQALGESEILQMKQSEILERQPKAMINVCEVETKLKLEAFPEQLDVKETFLSSQVTEQNTGKYRQSALGVECWRRFEYVEGDPTCERVKRAETEETEKQYSGASEKESDNRLTETFKRKEGGFILKEDYKDVDSADNSYRVLGQEVCGDEHPQGVEEDNESLMESGKQKATESSHREAVEDAENDKEHRLVHEWEEREGRCGDTSQTEYHGVRCRVVEKKAGNEEESLEAKGTLNLGRDPSMQAKLREFPEEVKPTEMNDYTRELKTDLNDEEDRLKTPAGRYKLDGEGHRELKTVPSCIIYEAEAEGDDTLDKEKFNELCKKKYGLQDADAYIASCKIVDSHGLPKPMKDASLYENMGVPCVVPEKRCSQSNHSLGAESITSTRDGRCAKIKGTQISNKSEDNGDSFTGHHEVRKFPTYVNKVEDAPSTLEHIEKALYSIKSAHSQRVETKDKNVKENLATKDQKGWERMKREVELENDHMRKLAEEREREREREKDRMAVDKSALQGHERLYAEAHERAERAAAERTTVELRLRRMASTRERLEKPSVQARLRAERPATERGTSISWSRAAEKISAQEARSDIHDRAEKNVAVRFRASFRSDDNRQSSLASDLHFQNTGNSNILQYSHASAPFGAEGESPQRCKARTERYKRTAERAANALAEKNRRDLLAQKEREERNRVAEVLDAEIRRWSNGKEGNLRALLSTLQYILGPDSGWQPVPLTEVITSAAVKRSYRKATLCVHPDKLQQRGATIQQKYISEKVFDLLKEAWNKFNAEER